MGFHRKKPGRNKSVERKEGNNTTVEKIMVLGPTERAGRFTRDNSQTLSHLIDDNKIAENPKLGERQSRVPSTENSTPEIKDSNLNKEEQFYIEK